MTTLKDIAKIIRSKNSGPYELTLDVLFDNPETFEKACRKNILTAEKISELYRIPADQVLSIVVYPVALAMKATIVRPLASGALGERDVYGAQQHVPLMQMELPDWD